MRRFRFLKDQEINQDNNITKDAAVNGLTTKIRHGVFENLQRVIIRVNEAHSTVRMLIIRFRKRVRIDIANRLRVVNTRGNRVGSWRRRISALI